MEEFGNDGIVMTNFTSNYEDRAFASVRKPNGEIIVGGYTKENGSVQKIGLAHYKPNGDLNTDVTNGGKVKLIGPGTPQNLRHMKWTADGKLVVGGFIRFINNDHFLFARLTGDGKMDPGFNNYGWTGLLYMTSEIDEVRSFEILPSGSIYAVGVINPQYVIPSKNMILIMLTPDGKRDSTFGENGMKEIKFANGVDDMAMCSLPSGTDMLIGGYFDNQEGSVRGFIMKVNQAGTVLWTKTYQPNGFKTYITNMIKLTDGNLLASGFCLDGNNSYPVIFKVNTSGVLIEEFGEDGIVIIETNQSTRGHRLVETNDAYYLMANVSGPFNIELYRFFKNGTLNADFGENGVMELDYENKADDGSGFYWLGGDSLLITGTTNNDFTLWKVDACVETTSVLPPEIHDVNIFPNPVSDVITIHLTENFHKVDRIEIFSIDGRFIKNSSHDELNQESNQISMPVNSLHPGVFIARIQSRGSTRLVKFVKT
jgi:uncharacterized delta-60 repeat protein